MMMCDLCKKNYAVVFITRIIDGKQINEGLCLKCAKKMGVGPVNNIIEQSGMSDQDVDNLNKQVGSIFENFDFNNTENGIQLNGEKASNPLFNFLNKAFSSNNNIPESNDEGIDENDIKNIVDNESKNNTRIKTQNKKNVKRRKFLDMYASNLNELAMNNKIDRVIGRNREIERVIQILNRRTKNNPVLIGEPGVGKTAIAEGLAVRIIERKVPAKIFNSEVYQLDLTALVAGTQFRGQFEGRMKGLIEEAKAAGNIILVIDELHNIIGAGEAEGALNAANILKPALSKGEIQIIGATTLNEYRRNIEKDSALERRFQPVIVDEPSVDESIEILKGIRVYYEDYHNVKIPDEVIESAVVLSERYISDRFLPDKAIDVIDEAGSRANLKNAALAELESLKHELKQVRDDKENAISADSIEDYQKAADYKVRECKLLEKIKLIEEKNKDFCITIEDVASVIEAWTKIPVQRITELETEKLVNLEARIHKRVIGQEKAVSSISKAIRRNRTGFRKRRKPASFIFVGPTGTGKTELAKALAAELFENEGALIRLDMSEYMEKHTVSKMIGSPPGYVGYDDGGQLTEKIRRKPYSIILMDEIEKAHPDVFNMLLQLLDDGRLTDSHGRVVNFENTVIIMTSNAGTSLKAKGIGFSNNEYRTTQNKVMDIIKETFRPEFLNRVDEIVVFTDLTKDELKQITWLMLGDIIRDMSEKGMEITITDEVVELIVEKGYDAKYGARPLRRTIQKMIEDELSEMYLKGLIKAGNHIKLDKENNEITIKTI